MIAVDTSVVVRYLTGAPPDQARRARVLLEGTDRLGVPIVVLLETGHVLRSRYGVSRSAVVDTLLDFITLEDVEILGLPKHAGIEA
ncbi:MAG: PIN domain-containing protein, partial [Chloroflexota bacterium]|nr:PIN domain-containing protein [Chloroflexota bacterium]